MLSLFSFLQGPASKYLQIIIVNFHVLIFVLIAYFQEVPTGSLRDHSADSSSDDASGNENYNHFHIRDKGAVSDDDDDDWDTDLEEDGMPSFFISHLILVL